MTQDETVKFTLRQQLAEAQKDAQRINWIAENCAGRQVQIALSLFNSGYEIAWGKNVKVFTGDIRTAIDQAMREGSDVSTDTNKIDT